MINLNNAFERLAIKLNKNKAQMIRSKPMQNIAITRSDVNTGQPIVKVDNNTFYTKEQLLKLSTFEKNNIKIFDIYKPIISGYEFNYINEFDQLIQQKGDDSFIGVVHIDGNNMGKIIRKIMSAVDENISLSEQMNEYVKKIRRISFEVDNNYKDAFNVMVQKLAEYEVKKEENQNKKVIDLPIRPIIINGDDITFVCKGRLALSLSESFLSTINRKTVDNKYRQSACAGIYFVHSHFPFHIAYDLAEQVCESAKKKAKAYASFELSKNSKNKKINYEEAAFNVRSWIDFDISFKGLTSTLEYSRSKIYNLPELDNVVMFKSCDKEYEGYNLLNRPYLICDEKMSKQYEFRYFKKLVKYFRNKIRNNNYAGWPRSKIKELRNAYITSPLLVEKLIQENKSRNRVLSSEIDIYSENTLNKGFNSKPCYTPFYDALEMIDLFEDIIGGE